MTIVSIFEHDAALEDALMTAEASLEAYLCGGELATTPHDELRRFLRFGAKFVLDERARAKDDPIWLYAVSHALVRESQRPVSVDLPSLDAFEAVPIGSPEQREQLFRTLSPAPHWTESQVAHFMMLLGHAHFASDGSVDSADEAYAYAFSFYKNANPARALLAAGRRLRTISGYEPQALLNVLDEIPATLPSAAPAEDEYCFTVQVADAFSACLSLGRVAGAVKPLTEILSRGLVLAKHLTNPSQVSSLHFSVACLARAVIRNKNNVDDTRPLWGLYETASLDETGLAATSQAIATERGEFFGHVAEGKRLGSIYRYEILNAWFAANRGDAAGALAAAKRAKAILKGEPLRTKRISTSECLEQLEPLSPNDKASFLLMALKEDGVSGDEYLEYRRFTIDCLRNLGAHDVATALEQEFGSIPADPDTSATSREARRRELGRERVGAPLVALATACRWVAENTRLSERELELVRLYEQQVLFGTLPALIDGVCSDEQLKELRSEVVQEIALHLVVDVVRRSTNDVSRARALFDGVARELHLDVRPLESFEALDIKDLDAPWAKILVSRLGIPDMWLGLFMAHAAYVSMDDDSQGEAHLVQG